MVSGSKVRESLVSSSSFNTYLKTHHVLVDQLGTGKNKSENKVSGSQELIVQIWR